MLNPTLSFSSFSLHPPPLRTLTISSPALLSLRRRLIHRRPPSPPSSSSSICLCAQTDASFLHQQYPPQEDGHWDASNYEALLRGGEQVTSVLQDMIKLLEDMDLDEDSERVAVEIAAQGVIGKRVDEMESGFMTAIEYMIQMAEKDNDEQRKSLLEVIKQIVLDHLAKKCPPHVQVIGLLCRTPEKESRHELLRRVAAGGGVFKSDKGLKVHLPGANLNDIANQADDLLEVYTRCARSEPDSCPSPPFPADPDAPRPSNIDLPIALRKGIRSCTNPLSNHISFDYLGPAFRAFAISLSSIEVPTSDSEAYQHLAWRPAMDEEMSALISRDTWELVAAPPSVDIVVGYLL